MLNRTLRAAALACALTLAPAAALAGPISGYPAATTPLSGSETTIGTQSGSTVQITTQSIANLAKPAGSSGQIQFNSSGAFGASSGLSWNSGSSTLTVNGLAIVNDSTGSHNVIDLAYSGGHAFASVAPAGVLGVGNTAGISSDTSAGVLDVGNGNYMDASGQLNAAILSATTKYVLPDGGFLTPSDDRLRTDLHFAQGGGSPGNGQVGQSNGVGIVTEDNTNPGYGLSLRASSGVAGLGAYIYSPYATNFELSLIANLTGEPVVNLENGNFDNELEVGASTAGGDMTQVAGIVLNDRMVPSGSIQHYTITNGGSGYGSAPSVSLSGGGCSSFPGLFANVSGGKVVSISTTGVGAGCTSAPSVAFSGGGGSGAAATAVIVTGQTDAGIGPQLLFHQWNDSLFVSPFVGFGWAKLSGNDLRFAAADNWAHAWDGSPSIQPYLHVPGGILFETGAGSSENSVFTAGERIHDVSGVLSVETPTGSAQAPIDVSFVRIAPTTLAGLSTADPSPADGDRAMVTDATSCTFGSTVSGSGSTKCPVYYDGAAWRAG